jgi:GAF domain-containing protein
MNSPDPAHSFALSIRYLGSSLVSGLLSPRQFKSQLCETLLNHFDCSRVGVWLFIEESDGWRLRCVGSHLRGTGYVTGGEELREHEYSVYFRELLRRGAYASSDVLIDPNLQGLVEPYFVPSGVRSLLDTAFQVNGRPVGVICIEQTGEPREWTGADRAHLRQSGAAVSLAIARLPAGFDLSANDED